MKRLFIIVCVVLCAVGAKAQGFPSTDSLRNYNTRFTTNSAITWFTNLRGQTLLRGIIDHIDSVSTGGIDTAYKSGDTLYITTNLPDTFKIYIAPGGGSISDGDKGDIVVSSSGATWTIDANAVGNSKFRQSSGLSVVGRSANSTGDVADITATTNGQALQYNGTSLVWDSVDYAKVKNTPQVNPGTYIAPGSLFNPGFLVIASAIVRPSNAFVHGTNITWEILDNVSGHNSSFIDSVYGNTGTGQLTLRYPNVKNVVNLTVNSDESFATQIMFQGPSVGFTTSQINAYRITPPIAVKLTGAGTTTWTKSNSLTATSIWDVTTYNTADGTTSFNVTTTTQTEYDALNIQYVGPNGYTIRRFYSGLGAYNVKFQLLDGFGNPVTTAPTSSDQVVITGAGINSSQVNMAIYSAASNAWLSSSYNFWVIGLFEAYMVAAPVSSTQAQVRWQPYTSATGYKIYRSTTLYGAKTLIYSGTAFRYEDTGLSANTKYFYHMYATISGVDTFITSFTTNTYQ